MSGGFHYLQGGPLSRARRYRARRDLRRHQNHKRAGDPIELLNRTWMISGVVESGMLSRAFIDLARLQDLTRNNGRISAIYAKVQGSQPNATPSWRHLKQKLPGFPDLFHAGISLAAYREQRAHAATFTRVIIGIGTLVGFLVVFLSMYTAVLERTREIGILKAMGGSPWFILNTLLRETVMLALVGSAAGHRDDIWRARLDLRVFAPQMITVIVPEWWPIATAISIVGALGGALYPACAPPGTM